MSDAVQLFAVTPNGAVALPVPPQATGIHDILDDMPLGVYEGLRTFDHVRFIGLEEHLDRAQRSMDAMGWTEELDRHSLRQCLHQVVSDYPHPDARVRFDVLAAVPPDLEHPARVVIALSPFEPVAPELMQAGVPVRLTSALRRTKPLVKMAEFVLARRAVPVLQADCFEQIMVDDGGRVLEGTTSNFFYVKDGVLGTTDIAVLEGVTRGFVLEIARAAGIEVREHALDAKDIAELDETFLTSSMKGIVPITRIDDAPVGSGLPGPITKRLLAAYNQFTDANARPAVD